MKVLKVVIDGDLRQSDIGDVNGLRWAVDMVKRNKSLSEFTGVVQFSSDDIVRSGLCGAWVRAIEKQYDNTSQKLFERYIKKRPMKFGLFILFCI